MFLPSASHHLQDKSHPAHDLVCQYHIGINYCAKNLNQDNFNNQYARRNFDLQTLWQCTCMLSKQLKEKGREQIRLIQSFTNHVRVADRHTVYSTQGIFYHLAHPF